jgi:ligand-binding SRPBCC domain-containing protein
MATLERWSRLETSAAPVWAWVTTPEGVNDELRPWLRMTVPSGWRRTPITEVDPGTHLGRSWVLLLGVVPFDYDDLTIAEIGPFWFLERSRLLSAPRWEHERTLVDTPDGCELRDRITFTSRFGPLVGMHTAILRAVFAHRHRRLHRRFGPRAPVGSPR